MARSYRLEHLTLFCILSITASCCGGSTPRQGPTDGPGEEPNQPEEPQTRTMPISQGGDVISTRLELDLSTRRGRSIIEVIPGTGGAVSLEAAGLEVQSVGDESGQIPFVYADGLLTVNLPAGTERARLTVEYGFRQQPPYQGEMVAGMVFTWPSFCGNLFPCHSHPTDGTTFELSLSGVPQGLRAIYPTSIPAEAPAYMLSWAVGRYEQLDLGRTSAGTQVDVWFFPEHRADAVTGSRHLREAFDWLERTYGPYLYGDRVAGVEVDWGPGAYGGMEHHPFWHVSPDSLDRENVQIHEAAHGWFGDGVRIRCWEDLVLSEGVTSYVTARATTMVIGPEAGERLWNDYEDRLQRAMNRCRILVARPPTCGEVDVLRDGLFCSIPYMKGAFFLKGVADQVGPEALDSALAAFYRERRGQAAGMSDLIETIAAQTGYDPAVCAAAWLGQAAIPAERSCPEASPTTR